jgi:uncharacterized membrane protein
MSMARFLMLLALVVWVGGIIFFAFVMAPAAFAVLPSHQLAGNVVNRVLPTLHWMGVVSGVVFLVAGMVASRSGSGGGHPARYLLVVLMIVLTLTSQVGVMHRMDRLRAEMGTIDALAPSDARRVEFNRLHGWSTRIEGTVLLLGLAVVYLTAREEQ